MSNQVEWAKRIAALANTGIFNAGNHYDRERYQQLLAIATEMLAVAAAADPADVALVLAADDGYITPKVDVRGAVFRDDKILLVREAIDGLWTLPGGWADIGDAPSEAVEREIREESGYQAKAIKLLALEDRKRRHSPSINEVYKVAFLCRVDRRRGADQPRNHRRRLVPRRRNPASLTRPRHGRADSALVPAPPPAQLADRIRLGRAYAPRLHRARLPLRRQRPNPQIHLLLPLIDSLCSKGIRLGLSLGAQCWR